jgi:hypothetical protein
MKEKEEKMKKKDSKKVIKNKQKHRKQNISDKTLEMYIISKLY